MWRPEAPHSSCKIPNLPRSSISATELPQCYGAKLRNNMNPRSTLLFALVLSAVFIFAPQRWAAQAQIAGAQNPAPQISALQVKEATGSPSLTIYNANFAVVRQNLLLDLQPRINHITFTDATAHIEPDSVILRDLDGKRTLQVLEQNYRNDPVSQALLL